MPLMKVVTQKGRKLRVGGQCSANLCPILPRNNKAPPISTGRRGAQTISPQATGLTSAPALERGLTRHHPSFSVNPVTCPGAPDALTPCPSPQRPSVKPSTLQAAGSTSPEAHKPWPGEQGKAIGPVSLSAAYRLLLFAPGGSWDRNLICI